MCPKPIHSSTTICNIHSRSEEEAFFKSCLRTCLDHCCQAGSGPRGKVQSRIHSHAFPADFQFGMCEGAGRGSSYQGMISNDLGAMVLGNKEEQPVFHKTGANCFK